jgi:transketolase
MKEEMYLVADIASDELAQEPVRKGFGQGLVLAGQDNPQVVAASADLTDSTYMNLFKDAFPDRFIEVGVAEQNLVTIAAGLAAMGKIPYVSSYAAFSPGRNWEQIRTTICLNNRPVKLIGSHSGISVGPDGATHQMLEDLTLMRVLPNMVVIAPADSLEASRATLAMAKDKRPNYMRLAREATPVFTTEKTPFEIGPAYVYAVGSDITIIATGILTYQALVAAKLLEKDNISAEVIHVPTIKPLDKQTILASVRKTKTVITVEEGQINGGLGGALAELLSEEEPTKLKRLGMVDHFGESGRPDQLLEKFGLNAAHIRLAAHLMKS